MYRREFDELCLLAWIAQGQREVEVAISDDGAPVILPVKARHLDLAVSDRRLAGTA